MFTRVQGDQAARDGPPSREGHPRAQNPRAYPLRSRSDRRTGNFYTKFSMTAAAILKREAWPFKRIVKKGRLAIGPSGSGRPRGPPGVLSLMTFRPLIVC